MSRFFTKKSVVSIFITILLFSFFSFNFASAAPADSTTNTSTYTSTAGQTETVTATTTQKSWWAKVMDFPGNAAKWVGEGLIGIVVGVSQAIFEFILIPIAGMCLAIAGKILNFSIEYTIYGAGFKAMAPAIQAVWALIRDACNISFIFLLLYAAIQQIISGAAKKDVLVAIIVSAVLINFSLFITRVVIDAGNLVATSIYRQIELTTNAGGLGVIENAVGDTASGAAKAFGITTSITLSERIMSNLQLKSIYSPDNTNTLEGPASLIFSFIKLLLILITFFVFMFLSAILIGRFIMLIFLMGASPVGFVGETIPGLGEVAKHWRKSLQDQVLIAPFLMFFMLLITKVGDVLMSAKSTDPMIIFFNYFIIIYLLIECVKITKNMSGVIGAFADKIAAGATGLALGAATGGAAFLGRRFVGGGANMLANSAYGKRLEGLAAKGGAAGFLAEKTLGGMKKTATATFDVRNAKIGKDNVGKMLGNVGGLNLAGDNAKAGGSYGKYGTGFVGEQSKKNAEVAKKADDMKKSSETYTKNYEASLKEKKEDLIVNIANEKDPRKKFEMEKELLSTGNKMKQIGDFQGAEDKVNAYKKERAKIEDEMRQKEEGALKKVTDFNDDTQKEAYQNEIDALQKEKEAKINILDDETSEAQETVQSMSKYGDSKMKALISLHQAKKNYAQHIRTRLTSINTREENAVSGRNIEKELTQEDKDKAKKDKADDEFLEKIAKKIKEDAEK